MAYAALISLQHTIHHLKNPQIIKSVDKELDSLHHMLKELDDERRRSMDRSVINELDAKIREAVWKLEDVLDSYQACQGVDQKGVEQEMDLFMKRVKKLRKQYNRVLKNPLPLEEDDAAVSSIDISTTVGLANLSEQVINCLTYLDLSESRTVSLVGMAGIGKTHLAALIYQHPLILQHFHSRAWVRVGPKDQMLNNIYIDIVAQIEGMPRDQFKEKSMGGLGYLLNKRLRDQRYLIVLDDIWSAQVLRDFEMLLPDNKGSRFLVTTRLQEVAQFRRHQIPFLNNEESWNLLWQNVFAQHSYFPSQLEKVGRKIAEKCEGLPLLILTVANILRGHDKTVEYWNKVAEKRTTTFTDAYDQIYKVLLPSYEYLPQHLKPCFLYMGVFPQTCEIPSSKLINLWAAEDFLEPWVLQDMEVFALNYLQDLVSKSLAIVCKQSFERYRRIKSSKLHSVYWHLSVTEARKSKLFHVLNKLTDVSFEKQRRLSVQNNILLGIKEVYDSMGAATSTTRSLLCTGEDHQYPVRICFNTMLLIRVLDALAIRFYEFPNEVLNLLQLRHLSLTHNGELPCSISHLQQLQCLILRRHHNIKWLQRDSTTWLPKEIWDIQELRHVRIMGSNLPDPSKGKELPNLQTLYVNANSCTEAVFKSIPRLKKLGITTELEPGAAAESQRCLEHIGALERLKSLKYVIVNPQQRSQIVMPPPNDLLYLPQCLKKLSLEGLAYPWKHMSAIGSLPSLQLLKLRCSAFQGPHWETEVGQFKNLEFLLLEDLDLVHWTAQDSYEKKWTTCKCFPSLRHLIIRHCYKLKMIPLQIGETSTVIPTLNTIELDECNPSLVDSAHQINKKMKYLQLVTNSSWNL